MNNILKNNKNMSVKNISTFFLLLFLSGCAGLPQSYDSSHPQVKKIHQAMLRHTKIKNEPWPEIPEKRAFNLSPTDPIFAVVKKRLKLLGDWSAECGQASKNNEGCLKQAVYHFQERHGLNSDGVLGENTIKKLNLSPKQRLTLMQNSLIKWHRLPAKNAAPYLLVNIPSYELLVINKGQTELSMRVVVGKPSWPTPTLNSEIKTIVLNPGWNVPTNITEKEIIHKVLVNPNYLEEHNLKIVESWAANAKEINPRSVDWNKYAGPKDMPYRLVQSPGAHSALGKIKFIFSNKDHIYLHDTPLKSLFNQPNRALSHGCIRLEQPMKLLNYLSQSNPKLQDDKIIPYLISSQTKYLALSKNMPLHITYINTWVDDKGNLQIRDNIYSFSET